MILFLDRSTSHDSWLQRLRTADGLFRSYLTDRDQQTCILGETSDIKRVLYGVPQGKVLGPLLFCYILMTLLSV